MVCVRASTLELVSRVGGGQVAQEEVDDLGASRMAKEISRRIQESLDYPGQVKVTVIRERRSVEYAK